jgi:hypothetical protein
MPGLVARHPADYLSSAPLDFLSVLPITILDGASLAVKDIEASRRFYEKHGIRP